MARKLKTYQTSLGFFDQAIAAREARPHSPRNERNRDSAENAQCRLEKQKHKLDLAVRRACK